MKTLCLVTPGRRGNHLCQCIMMDIWPVQQELNLLDLWADLYDYALSVFQLKPQSTEVEGRN